VFSDKNADNLDEATERFKEITNAYTTLSDPNERSWYDSHREQILRGGTGARGDGDDEDEGCGINLFPFFSSSCYTGYGDDEGGFYQVFSKVFDEIHDLEMQEDPDEGRAPSMGVSSTNWTDGPGQFYSFYESFSSRRSFSWCDKYNPNEAPNRQVKRAIDKENNKERNKGKRAFNETVRRLAAWVKKRDPRQMAHQQRMAEEASKKAEDDRKKQVEMKRLREEAREREKEDEIEVDEAMDDMYAEMELMKEFRGKKGKKLREQLLAQEAQAMAQKKAASEKARSGSAAAAGNDESDDESIEDDAEGSVEDSHEEGGEESGEEEDSVLAQLAKAREKKNKKKNKGRQAVFLSQEEEEEKSDDSDAAGAATGAKHDVNSESEGEDENGDEEDGEDSVLAQLARAREKKQNKAKGRRGPAAVLSSEEEEDGESESGCDEAQAFSKSEAHPVGEEPGAVEQMIQQLVEMGFSGERASLAVKECGDLDAALGFLMAQGCDDLDAGNDANAEDQKADTPKKLTGKKAKDARKQKAEEAAKAKIAEEGGVGEHVCNVCKEAFPSRSKLFSHIKVFFGHVVLVCRLTKASRPTHVCCVDDAWGREFCRL